MEGTRDESRRSLLHIPTRKECIDTAMNLRRWNLMNLRLLTNKNQLEQNILTSLLWSSEVAPAGGPSLQHAK